MTSLKQLSPWILLGVLALAGCKAKEYEPDPSTIPNIPPSDRASGGGGPAGEATPAGGKSGKLAAPK